MILLSHKSVIVHERHLASSLSAGPVGAFLCHTLLEEDYYLRHHHNNAGYKTFGKLAKSLLDSFSSNCSKSRIRGHRWLSSSSAKVVSHLHD